MKLKYIELKAANDEVFRIDGVHIGRMNVSGLSETIKRFANEDGEVCHSTNATSFALEIYQGAEEEYIPPMPKSKFISIDIQTCQTVFERLTRVPDIVEVRIIMDSSDDNKISVRTVSLPFSSNDGVNELETAAIGKSGNLYIAISCPVKDIASGDLKKSFDNQLELHF